MRTPAIITAALLLVFSFNACNISDSVPNGFSRVNFTLNGISSNINSRNTGTSPNEVVILNVADHTLERAPLETEEQSLLLEQDALYIVSFIFNPGLAEGWTGNPALNVLGHLCLTGAELDSIPLTELANDTIALGELENDGDSYNSTVDAEQTSQDLGMDSRTLQDLAAFDSSILGLLNPDINQNGIYDMYEPFNWAFNMTYGFEFNRSDVDMDSGMVTFAVNDIQQTGKSIFVSFNEEFLNYDFEMSKIKLDFSSRDGQLAHEVPCSRLQYDGRDGFEFAMNEAEYDSMPLPGNYILTIHDDQFPFINMDFMQPNSDYFLLLLYDLITDEQGNVTHIRWIWKETHNGEIVDANPEMIEVVTEQIYIYISTENTNWFLASNDADWIYDNWTDGSSGQLHGDSIFANGMVDITSLNAHISDVNLLNFRLRDISGGDISFQVIENQ